MTKASDSVQSSPASKSNNEILQAIRRIVQGISVQSKLLFKQTGLTIPQVLCLRIIAKGRHDDEVTAAIVSRQINLTPATVTGILDRLEKKGLIERVRRSKDRRKICLVLTEAGDAKLENLPESLQDRFLQQLLSKSEGERKQLLTSLNTIVDMIGARDIDASPILTAGDIREE